MLFDQAFYTRQTGIGLGIVASSDSSADFTAKCLYVGSDFSTEPTEETVEFVYYAKEFQRFVGVGISPAQYEDARGVNKLVHILVPQETSQDPCEYYLEYQFERSWDKGNVYTAIELLPCLKKEDLPVILRRYGLDRAKLSLLLTRVIPILLGEKNYLEIRLPELFHQQKLQRTAAREITWALSQLVPESQEEKKAVLRKRLSYSVFSTRNSRVANLSYVTELSAKEAGLDLNPETKPQSLSDTVDEASGSRELYDRMADRILESPEAYEEFLKELEAYRLSDYWNLHSLEMTFRFWLIQGYLDQRSDSRSASLSDKSLYAAFQEGIAYLRKYPQAVNREKLCRLLQRLAIEKKLYFYFTKRKDRELISSQLQDTADEEGRDWMAQLGDYVQRCFREEDYLKWLSIELGRVEDAMVPLYYEEMMAKCRKAGSLKECQMLTAHIRELLQGRSFLVENSLGRLDELEQNWLMADYDRMLATRSTEELILYPPRCRYTEQYPAQAWRMWAEKVFPGMVQLKPEQQILYGLFERRKDMLYTDTDPAVKKAFEEQIRQYCQGHFEYEMYAAVMLRCGYEQIWQQIGIGSLEQYQELQSYEESGYQQVMQTELGYGYPELSRRCYLLWRQISSHVPCDTDLADLAETEPDRRQLEGYLKALQEMLKSSAAESDRENFRRLEKLCFAIEGKEDFAGYWELYTRLENREPVNEENIAGMQELYAAAEKYADSLQDHLMTLKEEIEATLAKQQREEEERKLKEKVERYQSLNSERTRLDAAISEMEDRMRRLREQYAQALSDRMALEEKRAGLESEWTTLDVLVRELQASQALPEAKTECSEPAQNEVFEDAAQQVLDCVRAEAERRDTAAEVEAAVAAEQEASETVAKEEASETVAKEEASETVAKEETSETVAKEEASETVAEKAASDAAPEEKKLTKLGRIFRNSRR